MSLCSGDKKSSKIKIVTIIGMVIICIPVFVLLSRGCSDIIMRTGQYIEVMSHAEYDLMEQTRSYYEEHGRYPETIDVSQLKAYHKYELYPSVLDRIEYVTDGNSSP